MSEITFGAGAIIGKSREALVSHAQDADRLGFDVLCFGDHPSNWGPDFDPLVQMAFAAAATNRVKVASMVTILPLHHPVRLAQMVSTLDHLSNGRVILGVGVGGEYPKQFEAFGIPVSQRGRRTDEYIEILTGLWTLDSFDHHGEFFQFEGISQLPRPVQKPHPPIWIGGRPGGVEKGPDGQLRYKSKTAAARRAGRYGQGWIPYHVTVEQVKATVGDMRDAASAAGRDPDEIVIGLNNEWLIRDSIGEALAEASARTRYGSNPSSRIADYDLIGTPRDVIKRMEAYIQVGVTFFKCGFMCPPPEVHAQMELVARRIMPHFRATAPSQG